MRKVKQLTLRSWPRAIVHLDADAFFASVEQSVHPELKGKPVITGAERGIVAAASYEAKALGIARGTSLSEAAQICPELIMLPSDYETYSLYSKRIFEIMRRYTPAVEEYSIDEAFADLTGMRRTHHLGGYQAIAKQMQDTIMKELDIGVSVGMSLSKGLAKLCSKFRKPRGFTAVPGHLIHILLQRSPLDAVWGLGKNSVALLQKHGCKTAYDFVQKPRYFAEKHLGKNGLEIWLELRGECCHSVNTKPKTDYAMISKTKTFSPSTDNHDYLYAQAMRNLESACIKARRYELAPTGLRLYLREHNFRGRAIDATLNLSSNSPMALAPILRDLFESLRKPRTQYRTTGITLHGLKAARPNQLGLFDDPVRVIKTDNAGEVIDDINRRFGKHAVFMSDTLHLGSTPTQRSQAGRRGADATRRQNLLPGETTRKHLAIPMGQYKVH